MYPGNTLQTYLTDSGGYAVGKVDSLVKETVKQNQDTMQKINSRFQQNVTPKLNYAPK